MEDESNEDENLELMAEILRNMGASPDDIKKAKKEYEVTINFYNNLSDQEKELERKSMEAITENIDIDGYTKMSFAEQEDFARRVSLRFQLN